jgi:hypothetical protein
MDEQPTPAKGEPVANEKESEAEPLQGVRYIKPKI